MKQSMTEDADAEGEINQIVFAELVTHVVETQRGSTGCVVFKLADLCNLYESRLKQFETNSTFRLFPCCATMVDMPHDTLALVPQHLLRLMLPKVFDLASSVPTGGVLC
jgi:hypothetical protein